MSKLRNNATGAGANTQDKVDLSAVDSVPWTELLYDSFFPAWKGNTSGEELVSPDEMQRKDRLAMQVWRLYSKTKRRLPTRSGWRISHGA
ncbi:hypothetical protein B0J14DRAFT_611074 [Halenospora varia]|nr:hypothetical protein B0J14DRAFT_611074 [Halenospora varia]